MTDILAGNTDKKVNPFWGKWAIYDGKTRRPAAYKTGTTSDNRDVAAYGFLAPPADKKAPALAVGVWMGNSDNTPNDGKLSLDTSAPLWSAILTEVSKGEKIAQFKPPASGLVTATVDAFTGLKPGPFTTKTVSEYFLPGTVPTQKETTRVAATIDAGERPPVARRLRRTEGHQGLLQPVRGRVRTSRPGRRPTPTGAPGRPAARASVAARRAPGPRTSTTARSRRSAGRWGAPFAPDQAVPARTPAADLQSVPDPGPVRRHPATDLHPAADVRPAADAHAAAASDGDPEALTRRSSGGRSELDDRRPVAALATLAGTDRLDQRVRRGRRTDGVAHGAGAHPVDHQDLVEAGQSRVVEVARQGLERLVDPGAAQVER